MGRRNYAQGYRTPSQVRSNGHALGNPRHEFAAHLLKEHGYRGPMGSPEDYVIHDEMHRELAAYQEFAAATGRRALRGHIHP